MVVTAWIVVAVMVMVVDIVVIITLTGCDNYLTSISVKLIITIIS